MLFRRRIETTNYKSYFCNRIALLSGGFDTPSAIALGDSTTDFTIYLFTSFTISAYTFNVSSMSASECS